MLKSLKKAIIGCFLLFSVFECMAAEEIVGKDAPANYVWPSALETDMTFRLISLDSENRKLYVLKGDFFAPVEMRPRSFSQLYSVAKKDEITFYTRKELEKPKEGYALYVPAITVNTNSSSDVYLAFGKNKSGKLLAACIDVSLNAMPIPSLSVVNLSPYRVGIQLGGRLYSMNVFSSRTLPLAPSEKRSSRVGTVKFFNLKDPKSPSFIEQKSYSFWSYERVLVIVFNQKDAIKVPVFAAFNPSKRKNNGSMSSLSDILVLTNKGPR